MGAQHWALVGSSYLQASLETSPEDLGQLGASTNSCGLSKPSPYQALQVLLQSADLDLPPDLTSWADPVRGG